MKYGIYHCEVVPTDTTPAEVSKLFRPNKKNYYTHFDLRLAKELGMHIEMVGYGANACIYPERAPSNRIFGNYVDLLDGLKQRNIPFPKQILNALWGSLSMTNVYEFVRRKATYLIFTLTKHC